MRDLWRGVDWVQALLGRPAKGGQIGRVEGVGLGALVVPLGVVGAVDQAVAAVAGAPGPSAAPRWATEAGDGAGEGGPVVREGEVIWKNAAHT